MLLDYQEIAAQIVQRLSHTNRLEVSTLDLMESGYSINESFILMGYIESWASMKGFGIVLVARSFHRTKRPHYRWHFEKEN